MFCPLQKAVKMVGIHCVFFFVCREAKFALEVIGDHGIIILTRWQDPFIYRGKDHGIKIKVPALKHSHNLKPFHWFPDKVHSFRRQQGVIQALKGPDIPHIGIMGNIFGKLVK